MKVWVTRPRSSQVFSGGMRDVLVWLEKPSFDHRAFRTECLLYERNSDKCVAEINLENGWWTTSGGVKGKRFLKQEEALYNKVWDKIYESLVPAEKGSSVEYRMTEAEYLKLTEDDYEMRCTTHWKRFLLEIELATGTVTLIQPRVIMSDKGEDLPHPITEKIGRTSLFVDGDLDRPFYPTDFYQYEVRRGSIL